MPDKDKRTQGSTRNKEPTLGTERQGMFTFGFREKQEWVQRGWSSMWLRVAGKPRRGKKCNTKKKSMGKSEKQRKILESDRRVTEFDSRQAGKNEVEQGDVTSLPL